MRERKGDRKIDRGKNESEKEREGGKEIERRLTERGSAREIENERIRKGHTHTDEANQIIRSE